MYDALQSQAAKPQAASEMEMVAAVSQATKAAAEAATAAAGAAAICIIDPRLQAMFPGSAAGKRSSRPPGRKAISSSAFDDAHDEPSEAFPA